VCVDRTKVLQKELIIQSFSSLIEKNNRILALEKKRAQEARDDLKHILDNAVQAFFTIDQLRKIDRVYSKRTEEFFGEKLHKKNLEQLLDWNQDTTNSFTALLEFIVDQGLPWETLEELFSETYKVGDRQLEVIFRTISVAGEAVKILVVATDTTDKMALEVVLKQTSEENAFIISALEDCSQFNAFLFEVRMIMEQFKHDLNDSSVAGAQEEIINAIFRGLHTIKSGASSFQMNAVSKLAHRGESDLEACRQGEKTLNLEAIETLIKQLSDSIAERVDLARKFGVKIYTDGRTYEVPLIHVIDLEKLMMVAEADANKLADVNAFFRGQEILVTEKVLDLIQESFPLTSTQGKLIHTYVKRFKMLPIGNAFRRIPQVVSKLAEQLGKQVKPVEILGGDIRVPKDVVDLLQKELIHFYLNAVDHGIESGEEGLRQMLGKPKCATITTKIEQIEGDALLITIADDGCGINISKVKHLAQKRGLLDEQTANSISDSDAATLIFAPGFSTADNVTITSGRGVGLDVAKTNIEKCCGRIDVTTEQGVGTTFSIYVPLRRQVDKPLAIDGFVTARSAPIELDSDDLAAS